MTPRDAWKQEVRSRPLPSIAEALGLQRRGRNGWTPCPACGAEERSSSNRGRGPIGMRGGGWECWRPGCDAKGGALELIAAVELGRVSIGSAVEDWRRVHARAYQIGATAEAPDLEGPLPPRRQLPRARVEPPKPYPPMRQIRDLWTLGSWEVHATPEGRRWLGQLIPGGAEACPGDLARILPTPEQAAARWGLRGGRNRTQAPRWARWGALPWVEAGYRVLLPLYDACGRLRSLRARHIGQPEAGAPKAISPRGCRVDSLVFANRLGVQMLRGAASPPIVLICEGGTDTLAASLLCAPHVPRAILGVGSGAWTEEHAERIPPHAEVVIATDPDPAGDKYAERIEATLQGRGLSMRVRRANLSADVRDTLTRLARPGARR